MPQIDEEKLKDLKILDINNPPTKPLSYQAFPKVVYLHPKDKSQEARPKLVHDEAELKAALARGYRKEVHVPAVDKEAAELEGFDAEIPKGK